jgi:hypothetical protein
MLRVFYWTKGIQKGAESPRPFTLNLSLVDVPIVSQLNRVWFQLKY